MTQLVRNPAYDAIEDQLDAIGQKYRVHCLVRGTLLWAGCAFAATFVALGLHISWAIRPGRVWCWCSGSHRLALTAVCWVLRPLLFRPRPEQVARLIEVRVSGLHNGLTNSLLLARAPEVQGNPWLAAIFDEVLQTSNHRPLGQAVKFADLRFIALRLLAALVPLMLIWIIWPGPVAHGFRQMLQPTVFVPRTADNVRILQVSPGDVTLINGQPLEISVQVEADKAPSARVFFDAVLPAAELLPIAGASSQVTYSYRVEHIDQTLKYRVEVGSAQSPWYSVTAVRRVKMTDLTVKVTPPAYTRRSPAVTSINPAEPDKAPLTVPQGSRLEWAATLDVPVQSAMLQLGDAPPLATESSLQGRRFTGSCFITEDTPVAFLLTAGAGQIIARLPEQSILVHCTKDAPPAIEMTWPAQDVTVTPKQEIRIQARLSDDLGLSVGRVLYSASADQPMACVSEKTYADNPMSADVSYVLDVKPELRVHGQSVRVQVQAVDNRDLTALMKDAGVQTASTAVFEIKFREEAQILREEQEKIDKLRQILLAMLKRQQDLHARTLEFKPADNALMRKINAGQIDLRAQMVQTAETFPFREEDKIVQKTLLMLAQNPAKDAVDLSATIPLEAVAKEKARLFADLQSRQRRIVSILESLLAMLKISAEPATQPTARTGADLANKKEAFEKLNEALKQFMAEEKRIMDQTAPLAKKPVDNWSSNDKKLADELRMSQEKMDAFMQEKVNDFSKNMEQDMANSALLKDLLAVYSEVTMAADALKQKAAEIAVSAQNAALEEAGKADQEIADNIEKWLPNTPDRQKWTMEDPEGKGDIPMPELPKELEDMVGQLMEQQEDLFEEMEDANANWATSGNKGLGWGAADGPIASMAAKGVTGNALPNNNEMGGRSGEGRSGKSQGEFVGDTATGKGGRNTPTRLDPTNFEKGQVKDESKDPVGGATGGGKLSGQGGAGLEGPVPPKLKQEMQRLAQKQAELRNNAERLNLQYKLGRYDNFKLLQSITLMRRVESDLQANRYQSALRRRDVLLDAMDSSKMLLGGQIHVEHDTTPAANRKVEQDISDALKGDLPPAWSDALKEYYKKLAAQ